MQQYLQYGSNVNLQTTFSDMQLGEDANLTLAKAAFEDAVTPGSARVRIYTTFKKPGKSNILDGSEGINPIRVNFQNINATGREANSSADLTTHTPKGIQAHDTNVTFLYSKVTPQRKLYVTDQSSVLTPLHIIAYCDYGPLICQGFDLNSSINVPHESSSWYLTSNLFRAGADLGTIDLSVAYFGERPPGNAFLSEYHNAGFEVDGSKDNLSVGLPAGDPRPVTVEVSYLLPASSPWLKYDPASEYYRVRFIPTPTEWTGYGKTGHVVDDDISSVKTRRLEW